MNDSRKSALILGVTGQDGALLARHLLERGWTVHGGFRRGNASKLWRLEELDIQSRLNLVNINLHEPHQVIDVISTLQPDHIYHFAGESFVADSFQQPRSIIETNTLGTINVLEAVRMFSKASRLFFASSSEVFGDEHDGQPLDEMSAFRPNNPYSISKLAAQQMVGVYRERHGLHAVAGIMFNHESPFRARNFVTRKISYNMARLKLDDGSPMQLGALSGARDWGSAEDYVKAIPALLDLDYASDFVFATGRSTSVGEFLLMAGEAAGFSPVIEGEGRNAECRDTRTGKVLAVIADRYFRPFDTPSLIGNPNKLKNATGFTGSRDVATIAQEMVAADLDRRKQGMTHV